MRVLTGGTLPPNPPIPISGKKMEQALEALKSTEYVPVRCAARLAVTDTALLNLQIGWRFTRHESGQDSP
ncbi:MAG: hypothetical protein U0528_02555 [Anaerolineae bacterium]